MAYPPPHAGQYFAGQPQPLQQPGPSNGSETAPPAFIPPEQHRQIPIAPYPSYVSQQQQFRPVPFPASPPATTFPPRPVNQLHPAPPHVALQYVAPPSPAGHYYHHLPNSSNIYPAPHPQYQAPPPPRPQAQPQPRLSAGSASPYPQIEINPPPLAQVQRLSVGTDEINAPPVALTGPRDPASIQMSPPVSTRAKPAKPSKKCDKKSIDYQTLLLSLADGYFDAAHSQGTIVAASAQEADIEQYYKLVATGLCCIEAVLKNWRLSPRTEALLRLRYARILYEETNNDLQAETALSKGIDLCERNRMFDLKYSMQQLLCRVLYKSNPKAAVKAVDGMIQDIETYHHTAWEYAFRFLRATLSLSSQPHQDFIAAVHNLQKLSSLANQSGDKAVVAASSIVEALVHLQQSSTNDAIEQAQRAIAVARSHQLSQNAGDNPHLSTMIQITDICCSVLEYDIAQASQKLQFLQKNMDKNINNPLWQDDGSFSVPLSPAAATHSPVGFGEILQVQNGRPVLILNWLPEVDLYALCYFLSSVTLSVRNSQDGHKAEKYLQEGLRLIKGNIDSPQEVSESLMFASARLLWRRRLHCHMLLQQTFLACARTDWPLANRLLAELEANSQELGDDSNETIHCLIQYAIGVVAQASGDLKKALATFEQPVFTLSPAINRVCRNDPRRDTAILAGFNRVLIYRDSSRLSSSTAADILNSLDTFCQHSPNKYIQAAYSFVSATIHTDSPMQTKRSLHQSLQAATAICNSQVTCLALTFMSWQYFRGVVGEQSEKSARAASAMAKKTDDKLWISVTDELLAETLDCQGKANEAMALRKRADNDLITLPSVLTKSAKTASSQSTSTTEVRMAAVSI